MITFDFEYTFSDLQVCFQDFKDAAPDGGLGLEDFREDIDKLIQSGNSFIKAKGGYTLTDIQVLTEINDTENLQTGNPEAGFPAEMYRKGTCLKLSREGLTEAFETGKIITDKLTAAEQAVVFACTAGNGIRKKYDEFMDQQDPLNAYLVDILGSASVEKAIDKIQASLQETMAEKGLKISNRYSPGYCGWNVKEQHRLFKFLPEHYCGISLTETALMIPIKSVSGIIGIGKNIQMQEYTCGLCQLDHCLYRRKKHQND